MNQTKKTRLCVLLAACLIGTLTATACGRVEPPTEEGKGTTVSLQTYSEPLDFHTELQKSYLQSGDPQTLTAQVDGKTEYSLPDSVRLEWTNTAQSPSYTVRISESEDFQAFRTVRSSTTAVEIYNLKIATQYYWKVSENKKDGTTSAVGTFRTAEYGPRNLKVDGITNVRDVGGWQTESGERTVQGLLYRGGRLNDSYPTGWVKGGDDTGYTVSPEITEVGSATFREELGIRTEIDLRTRDRNGYPGTTDANETLYSMVDGVQYVSIPMNGNADINSNQAAIKQMFEVLAVRDNYPVYYHCNIGTDRTGMVSYLLNALCGVGETDLYYDYMFSDFGLIALPSPQVSNPTRKELSDLTGASGAAGRVKAYSGATLADKARACLKACGLSDATIDAVRSIMTAA